MDAPNQANALRRGHKTESYLLQADSQSFFTSAFGVI